MAEERVVLTAELRDQMSAPLETAARRVDGFTRTVETGARRQAAATDRSTGQITGAVGRQNRLFSGMTGVVGRATTGTSRLFGTMRDSITGSLAGIAPEATAAGEASGSGFASGLQAMIAPALAALSVGTALSFADAAVASFSELEDSSAAAGVVFGDSMQAIMDQAATADKTLGLSQQAVINGANTFGTYGKAAGLAGDDLSGFATGLTGLAGDMASFKGTSTEQALEAIASGLRGEAEPLRAFGVMLDDVQMRDEAMRMGLIKTTKDALTPQQKVLAAQALIFAQTTDAQGDFARTSTSTANIAKTLAAASENLSAKIGKVLAPAFTAARKKALGAVTAVSGFADNVMAAQKVIEAGGTNRDIGKALGLSGKTLDMFDTGLGSIKAFFAAFKSGDDEITSSGIPGKFEKLGVALRNAWDAGVKVAQWLWDMRAPIGIIAGLILFALIPHWIDLGVKALISAGKQKAAWAIARVEAIKAAFAHSWAVTTMVADWIILGAKSTAEAAKIAAAWLVVKISAQKATVAHSLAVAAMVGGWVLMGAQATIQAVKIAAAWLIALGPVGWIIAGIALLVAGVIWAYNNIGWFKDGVDAAFKWIGEAARNVADWVVGAFNNIVSFWQTDVMPALDAVGKFFEDTFTNIGNFARDFVGFFVDGWGMLVDFWNNTLMPAFQAVADFFAPIFDWIGRLIWNFATIAVALFNKLVDFWNGVLLPALQNLGKMIGDVVAWIYDTIIKPYIDLWIGAFNGIVDFWNGILVPAFQAVGDAIMTILNWIYTTIIQPIVNLIVGAFNGIIDFWNGILLPALQYLGDGFMTTLNWIYATIIQPVIDLVVGAFNGIIDFWNGILLPALQYLGDGFMTTLNWIYATIIQPVIDLIVGAFGMLTDFWNNTLKPVIDTVGSWFSEIIGGAINGVKSFIDDLVRGFQILMTFIGDKLQPVIDGIRGTFETLGRIIGDVLGKIGEFMNNPLGGIQDMLGIKKDENGQGIMPENSGGGVYAGNGVRFSGGGVLGGYAPGHDSILARLSPGESVLVPELTRAIGPGNIMAANAAASGGRKAGSGPALRSGHSGGRGGGGGGMTVHAPINITVQAGADGGIDYAALQAAAAGAVNDVVDTYNRRAY